MKNNKIKTSLAKLELLLTKLKMGGEEKKLWKEIKTYWQRQRFLTVKVISCVPLTSENLKIIENKISLHLNVPFNLENIIDPKILGGLRIQMGEKVFDATLNQQLEAIKPWLKDSFTL